VRRPFGGGLKEVMTMDLQSIRRVTVAGAGVLGAQIGFQAAVHGFNLLLYDISDVALEAGRRRLEALKAAYDDNAVASPEQTAAALARTTLTTSLSDALADADLLIEAIPERLDIKQAFYTQLQAVAPVKTIFASNSSTMVPSQLAAYTGRPERFLHLHFATPVWQHNTAEIMAHPHTDPAVFEAVITFSKQMGMVPIPMNKEQSGYVLDALLVPFLLAALQLFVDGVAHCESAAVLQPPKSIGKWTNKLLQICCILDDSTMIIKRGRRQSGSGQSLRVDSVKGGTTGAKMFSIVCHLATRIRIGRQKRWLRSRAIAHAV
jgi:3-hydroxyacyl-CoA dehydrogenase, NAD binding domain